MIAMVAVVMMMGHASATTPGVTTAKVTGANNLTVVFNTSVNATATDFTDLNGSIGARNVTGITGTTTNTIVVTFDGAAVGTDATATIDLGTGINSVDTTTALVAVEDQVVADGQAPTMSSAARVDNTHITVTMNESVKNLGDADGGFIVAKNGDPETTYAVSAIAAGSSANLVVLTVADISGSIATGVNVTYNASATNGNITDLAGNALSTDTTGVIVAAWQTSSGGSGGDGTYPPGWHETPTVTVTATKAPTPSATATATAAPPGDKVTPAPTEKPEAEKAATPAAEGTTAETPKSTPGFTAVFVIAGMLAVAYAMMRRRE